MKTFHETCVLCIIHVWNLSEFEQLRHLSQWKWLSLVPYSCGTLFSLPFSPNVFASVVWFIQDCSFLQTAVKYSLESVVPPPRISNLRDVWTRYVVVSSAFFFTCVVAALDLSRRVAFSQSANANNQTLLSNSFCVSHCSQMFPLHSRSVSPKLWLPSAQIPLRCLQIAVATF